MIPVEELEFSGLEGKAGSDYPFQDLQDSLEEDNNPKGGGGIAGWFTRLVQDYAIGSFEGGRVMPEL